MKKIENFSYQHTFSFSDLLYAYMVVNTSQVLVMEHGQIGMVDTKTEAVINKYYA